MDMLLVLLVSAVTAQSNRLVEGTHYNVHMMLQTTDNELNDCYHMTAMGVRGVRSPLYNTSAHLDCVFNLPVRVRDWKTDKILANCGEIGPTMKIATTMLINEQCPGFNACDISVCNEVRNSLCVPGVTSEGFEQCLSSWRQPCERDRTCVWWCDKEPYPVQIVLDSEQSTLSVAWRADACGSVNRLRLVTDDDAEYLPVHITDTPYNLTEVYFMSADELWTSNVLITEGMATVSFPFNSEKHYRLEADVAGAYLGVQPIDLLDFNKRQGYPDHFKTFTLECWAASGDYPHSQGPGQAQYTYSCEVKAKVQLQVFVNGFLRDDMWIGKGQIDLPWTNDKNHTLPRCTIRAISVSGEEIYREFELRRGDAPRSSVGEETRKEETTQTKRVTDDTKAVLFTIDGITKSQSDKTYANGVDDSVYVTQSNTDKWKDPGETMMISNQSEDEEGETEHVKREKSGAIERCTVLYVVAMVYALYIH